MEQGLFFLLLISIAVKSQEDLESSTEATSTDMVQLCSNFTSHYKEFHSNCCAFPPFFPPEVTRVCGSLYEVIATVVSKNTTAVWKQPLTVCDHWKCILKEHNLLNDDNETVKEMEYYDHLDKWAEKHQGYKNSMINARVHCIAKSKKRMVMKVCDFFNIHGCIIRYISKMCPSTFEDEDCGRVAQMIDLCQKLNKLLRINPYIDTRLQL